MTNVKKILAILLALCIVCGGTSVLAAGQTVTYTSPTSRYQAQKFSHPDAGVGEIDGIIEYDSGENDRGQNYSWSAQGYGDYMYVGTCYAAIYATINIMAKQSGVDVEVFKAGLNALYNGTLYMGDLENNPSDARRSILVRVNVRTGEVKLVAEPKNMGGYRASITYNGKLYFVAADASPYLLEIDPENNDATQVVYTCARPSDPFISVGIRGLAVVNGMLIASMIGDNGTYIVASENPSAGQASFETIGTQEDLPDYPAYMYNDSIFGGAIWDMIGFQDKLYFTVVTGKAGNKQAFAMFCGEQDEATGEWSYRLIIGDEADGARYPFGLGADRSGAANLIVHDGYLYIGGYNDPMIALPGVLQMDFEELYKDLDSPVCLWRMDANENIDLVAGEANQLFPEVKGNLGAGLGSNLNQYVWRMESYNGKLYVGTFDIGSLAYPLMQVTNGDILKRSPEEWKTQFEYIIKLLELLKSSGSLAARSATGISSMSATLTSMTSLLNQGGIEDLASTEAFYSLLKKVVSLYENLRKYLPDSITEKLDGIFNQDTVDNFYYFIGVCKYLSKGERGFDLLVSGDGINFDAITRNGFGDPYNHGCRVFAITDAGLCLGTANPFYGTQLWRLEDLAEDSQNPAGDETEQAPSQPEAANPNAPDSSDQTQADTEQADATQKPDLAGQQDETEQGTQPEQNEGTGASADEPDIPATSESTAGIALALTAVMAGGVLVLLHRRKAK